MQYIDNDMDDLFKKAGENYPLRTDGSNWDAVQARLAVTNDEADIYPPKKFNRNYLWLLLLLLIPMVLITYKSDNTAITRNTVQLKTGNSVSAKTDAGSSNKNNSGEPLTGVVKSDNGNDQATDNNQNLVNDNSSANRSNNSFSEITAGNKQSKKNNQYSEKVNQDNEKEILQAGIIDAGSENKTTPTFQRNVPSEQKEPVPVDSTTAIRQPKRTDSVSTNKTDTTAAKKQQPKKVDSKKNGFYYGIVAGPDISTIKAQKVTNAGYSVGAVLGYRIDRHWAIEAGALWDEKKYYTKGDYFDKTGANIPSSVTVHYLDGACNMLEFPIAVRYDLNLKKNSFFVTAGLTSYVMKNESYRYGADNNGNYYEGFKTYKNSGNHLFANFQLSAGYNYNLSRKLSLRIEPYMKMPVKDIGIGSMPISSKGIYIGIMRSIR